MTDYPAYPNLEPHHVLNEVTHNGIALLIVVCPFTDGPAGPHFETSWSANAEPAEINCLFCEYLNGALYHAGPPEHGDEAPDDSIGGGAHAITHVTDYQACRVPLRRFLFCRVSVVAHEGWKARLDRVSALYEVHVARGEPWRVRQGDTAFYCCRTIRGSSTMSKHSWGCAGDVNWDTNPWHSTHCDHPMWFRTAMKIRGEGAGAGHGQDWSHGHTDPMHYSLFPNEGGDGLLYVGPTEEDDLPYTEAQLQAIVRGVLDEEPTAKTLVRTGWRYMVWKALYRQKPAGIYDEHLNVVTIEQERQARVLTAVAKKVGVTFDENGEPIP